MLADATAPGGAPGVVRRLLGAFAGPARTRAADRVCADAANLPLRDASIDLVFSNLMLHWHPQPHRVFPEFRRVLADGGLLMFSCFGPDTLAELRSAFRETNVPAAPLPFVDMHDFGDMLVASGFATPVMDAERLTLTFSSARALLREVSMLGGNPRSDRPRGLPSGERARALLRRLDDRRDADGRIGLTFEVAYGHAWKPAAAIDGRSGRRGADGVASVPLEQVRDALGRRRHRENEENDL
jgi:malonyl-CoA O-methyltransferase